jgi:hypothetical protein
VQDKINATDMNRAFWDFGYKGLTIESRIPKKETGIVSILHGLLFDIAAAKNFQILPEHPAAGGRLDFLISGILRTGKVVKACVEFKHAHSSELEHGFSSQLPAYMQGEAARFGIYCVLYFKGSWFDKPVYSIHELEFQLELIRSSRGLSNITLIFLDLSKRTVLSKEENDGTIF